MNIDYDEIPIFSTTTSGYVAVMSTTVGTTQEENTTYSSARLIPGVTEYQKDIILISIIGLCLLLGIIMAVICIKWRKCKRKHQIEFNLLKNGSSQSVLNTSKLD